MARINLGGVKVDVPGFHPIIMFRLWRVARKMRNDKVFEAQAIAAFAEAGMKVTTTTRDPDGEITEMRRW